MSWSVVLLVLLFICAIIYWLLVVSEGAYLGRNVVIALYDRYAPQYDEVKGVMPDQDGSHLAGPLVAALRPMSKPVVLDIATGTGRLPRALLRQLDFEGKVVGLDAAQRMLAIAQHRMENQAGRVGWVRQDAMALPFADATFGAVTCVEALEFLPTPTQALAEMVRVLRPGGHLLVSNRVGLDALFFPGRALPRPGLEKHLLELGLSNVATRRWQVHYDLVDAEKPANRLERETSSDSTS